MWKTPVFWYKPKSYLAYCLLPLSYIYRLAHYLNKQLTITKKAPLPIICIGNLIAGGAGKTPTAIALAKILLKSGIKLCFVTRGYKGKSSQTVKVDLTEHTSFHVGDEALLLAKIAPTYVNSNRNRAISAAYQDGMELVLLDDGLQNPSFSKDINILVIDGLHGFGNNFILPAGPLREPLKCALSKVDYAIIIGDDQTNIRSKIPKDIPVINGSIEIAENFNLKDQRFIAFTGIGLPNKFFNTLKKTGARIIFQKIFADHYQYKKSDLDQLQSIANKYDAQLITTEKDKVRLTAFEPHNIKILPISLKLDEMDLSPLIQAIRKKL